MLNATWLNTFATLCETGHFTRAAGRLNMTQPGVSQHLRKLERQIGRPLISRDGKGFTLTPAGEEVLAVALARRTEERLLRDAIAADDRDSGALAIGCSGSFALLLAPILMPWMASAPNLTLHLEAAPQTAIRAGLLENRFDLGVLAADPDHPRLLARHLGQEELCLILPAGAEPPARLADLDARGFIAHPDGYGYADDLLAPNFPNDFAGADRLRLRATLNQIGQIPIPVARGIGYTLLPRSGIAAHPDLKRLAVVALPQRRFHDLWLVVRRGRDLTARVRYAQDLIAQAATRAQDAGR